MNRPDQQQQKRVNEKRRGIGFETVAGMGGAIVEKLSENSINGSAVTLMVDSGASGHYFDDKTMRNLKHRLQDWEYLATPLTILPTGGSMLDGAAKGVLQGLVTDDNGSQIRVRIYIMVMPEIGRNLFSVMTAAKKGIVVILDYETPRIKGIDITVPLQGKNDDIYLFVLDLIADGYGAEELAMNEVANAQVWHNRRLGRLHAQSLQLGYKHLIEPFKPVVLGDYLNV